MDETRSTASRFAIAIGVFLLVEGIWGMFSPVVFGVLTTNMLHAAIHIVLGLVGIWTGTKGGASRFLMFLGVLLVAVGVLRFVPVAGDLLVSLLNVNVAVAWFNIVVGAVSLIMARSGTRSVTGS
ncbi:hypothetical protein BH11GEM1_BH11GEM1_04750 [soil metagenome]